MSCPSVVDVAGARWENDKLGDKKKSSALTYFNILSQNSVSSDVRQLGQWRELGSLHKTEQKRSSCSNTCNGKMKTEAS